MNKILAITSFVLVTMTACAFGADLDIGTHASFFLPPEGGGNTLMTGIDANYRVGPYFSLRGSVDNASYATNDHKYSVTSITLTAIEHLMGDSPIDPYIGAGAGLYDKTIDGDPNSTTGLNALAGIAARFQTFNVGFELKYTIPDTRYMETGYYSVGGQMTGGLHVSL